MTTDESKHDGEQAALKALSSGKKYKSPNEAYNEAYPNNQKDERNLNHFRWGSFYTTWNNQEGIRKRKLYKVDEFMEKLDSLCKEYDVSLSSGCGCCGAGGHIGNKGDAYEFSLDIKH